MTVNHSFSLINTTFKPQLVSHCLLLFLRSASSVNCLFGQRVSNTQEVSASDHNHLVNTGRHSPQPKTLDATSLTTTPKSCQFNFTCNIFLFNQELFNRFY